MYKIGEFSKINKISQRMLRFYDERGLLKPIKNEVNGYRYYTNEDMDTITKIKYFRDNKFSVEEIKKILKMSEDEVEEACKEKLKELNKKCEKNFNIIEELKKQIGMEKINIINSYDITKGKIEGGNYYISMREKVSSEEFEDAIDRFNELLKNINLKFVGKYFVIFHSIDEKYDVELCQVIKDKYKEAKVLMESEYISTIHFGHYITLNKAYEALFNWAKLNGYKLIGGYTEKYYVDEYVINDRNNFITQVSVCIEKT